MKSLTVQIPKPCHERWADMRPNEQGRFCASCQKTVVDYTALSDRELARVLSRASGEICGQLRHDQINRPLVIPNQENPFWRHWLSILTMGALSWQTAQAQSGQATLPRSAAVQPLKALSIRGGTLPLANQEAIPEDSNQVAVSGRVMFADSTGAVSVVPNATIHVLKANPLVANQYHLRYGKTDSAGVFSICLPVSWLTQKLTMSAFTQNYTAPRHYVNVVSGTTSLTLEDIVLNETMHVRSISGGGLSVVKSLSRWQRLKSKLFQKTDK